MLAVASVPLVYATSQLDEGMLCVFLYWESLVMVRYSLQYFKRLECRRRRRRCRRRCVP